MRFVSEGLPLVDVGFSSTSTFGVEADADDGDDDLVSSFWGADAKCESCEGESLRTTILEFVFVLSDRPAVVMGAGMALFDDVVDTILSMGVGDVLVDEFVSQAQTVIYGFVGRAFLEASCVCGVGSRSFGVTGQMALLLFLQHGRR